MAKYKVNIDGVWTNVCDCKYKVRYTNPFAGDSWHQIAAGNKYWDGTEWQPIVCPPTNVGLSVSGVIATLTWNDSTGATRYYIDRKINDESYLYIGTFIDAGIESYTDSLPNEVTKVRYRIRAWNDGSYSDYAYSPERTVST